jgi:hypothetical protein
MLFPYDQPIAAVRTLPSIWRIDLNLTAFDGHISRSRAIFPAFFRHSV